MSWTHFLKEVEKVAKEVAEDVGEVVPSTIGPHHYGSAEWQGIIGKIFAMEDKILEALKHLMHARNALKPDSVDE